MNTIIRGAATATFALGFSFSVTAHGAVVQFDDITTNQVTQIDLEFPGSVYSGFLWSNAGVVSQNNTLGTVSGFQNSAFSGDYVAFNLGGTPMTVANSGGFTFDGAYLSAGWLDGLNLDVKGFSGGVELFSTTVVVNVSAPTWFGFNYTGIDELVFNAYNGGSSQTQFALDDFTVSNFTPLAVPVPAALWLFASGFVALLGWGRRKA